MVPDPLRSLAHCSEPLGYDRYGNSYWILSPQEASTLFPYQPNGAAIQISTGGASTATGKPPVEPCVLIREASGWWGYHSGTELPALLSSFSSEMICERVLILKLIEKLAYTRCIALRSILTVRAMQRDWIIRRIRTEQWVHNVKMPSDSLPAVQMNRLLELVWSRCVEVRNQLHTSSLYKLDDDPPMPSPRSEKENMLKKQKKIRDVLTDDSFEHHLVRGWNRIDALQRIRQTAASTTATRLVADPSIYPYLVNNVRRTPLLVKNAPEFSVVPGQAVGGDEGEEEGEESRKVAAVADAPAVVAAEPAVAAPAPVSSLTVTEAPMLAPSVTEAPMSAPAVTEAAPNCAPAASVIEPTTVVAAPVTSVTESTPASAPVPAPAVVVDAATEATTIVAESAPAVVTQPVAESVAVPNGTEFAPDCNPVATTAKAAAIVAVPAVTDDVPSPTQAHEETPLVSVSEVPRNGTALAAAAETDCEQMDVVEPESSTSPAPIAATAVEIVDPSTTALDAAAAAKEEDVEAMEVVTEAPTADPTKQEDSTEATQPATAVAETESKETVAPTHAAPTSTVLPPPQLQGLANSATVPNTLKFIYPPIPPGRVLPDLAAIIQANVRTGYEPKTKTVEMLHLVTGELLRVFPSGKEAAAFFGVAQSNISLCLHSTKTDYLGFKWRQYAGPPFICKYSSYDAMFALLSDFIAYFMYYSVVQSRLSRTCNHRARSAWQCK